MQAHPLSSLAARIPFQSPAPSPTAQTAPPKPASLHLLGSRRPPHPDPNPSASPSPAPTPSPGIAQSSGLAHDAGNLLGALGLYCDLLRVPGVLRPEHRHYATELGLISSRSSELIRRLLTLSLNQPPNPQPTAAPSATSASAPPQSQQPHTDPFRLQPTDVRRGDAHTPESPTPESPTLDHASTLRNLAPVLQRIAAGTATVSVVAPSSLPPHDLPAEALERIAVNLVRNAVEALRKQQPEASASAARSTGEIRVALGILTGRLQLIVEDNGPGVPPPIAAAFMNPGKLPPNTHRGLGHRIVHDLVTSTGGQISVRTRPGHGTLFCMKWPLASASTAPSTSPSITGVSHLYLADSIPSAALGPASAPIAQKGLATC
jgi:signal transduction histidine kinase